MHYAFQQFAQVMLHCPRLILLLLVGCCAGCYMPAPILSSSEPNVIIFRGRGGYFPQLAEFEESLLDEGACPTVAYPEFHEKVAERVIAARNTGRLQGPLVIVGYSNGADKAMEMSRQLGQHGILVDKLVLLEPSDGGRVPANVRDCINIYKPQPWGEVFPYLSGARVIVDNAKTHLVNYNLREFNDGRYDGDYYLTYTTNPFIQDMYTTTPFIQDMMIDDVMVAFEPRLDEMEMPYESESRPVNVSVSREMPPVEND
jgi:hypothetical protein